MTNGSRRRQGDRDFDRDQRPRPSLSPGASEAGGRDRAPASLHWGPDRAAGVHSSHAPV